MRRSFQLRKVAWIVGLLCSLMIAGCGGSDAKSEGQPTFLRTGDKGLVEVSGGSQRVIIQFNDGSYIIDPAVSADGKRIAYALQRPAGKLANGQVDYGSDLYVIGRDGKDPQEVVHHASPGEFIGHPVWLHDGNTILFEARGNDSAGNSDSRVESIDLRSGHRQRLIDNALEPALSQDGKILAYVAVDPETQHEQILTRPVGGGKATPVTAADGTQVFIIELSWSPDDSQIAFAAADPYVLAPGGASVGHGIAALHPFLQDVWVINSDGSGLRRIADIGESQPSLTWSEDGAYVYVLGASNLWRIRVSDGDRQVVGAGTPQGQIRLLTRS